MLVFRKVLILIGTFLIEMLLVATYLWTKKTIPLPVVVFIAVLSLGFWTLKLGWIWRNEDAPWWAVYFSLGSALIVGCVSGMLAGAIVNSTLFMWVVGCLMFGVDFLLQIVAFFGNVIWNDPKIEKK